MRVKHVTPRHPLWHVKSWGEVVLTWRDELIAELKGAFREALMPLRGSGEHRKREYLADIVSTVVRSTPCERVDANSGSQKRLWGKSARGEHMWLVRDDD